MSDAEKQTRLQAIEKARATLLSHADGLNKKLFERRGKSVPQVNLLPWLNPHYSELIVGPRG